MVDNAMEYVAPKKKKEKTNKIVQSEENGQLPSEDIDYNEVVIKQKSTGLPNSYYAMELLKSEGVAGNCKLIYGMELLKSEGVAGNCKLIYGMELLKSEGVAGNCKLIYSFIYLYSLKKNY